MPGLVIAAVAASVLIGAYVGVLVFAPAKALLALLLVLLPAAFVALVTLMFAGVIAEQAVLASSVAAATASAAVFGGLRFWMTRELRPAVNLGLEIEVNSRHEDLAVMTIRLHTANDSRSDLTNLKARLLVVSAALRDLRQGLATSGSCQLLEVHGSSRVPGTVDVQIDPEAVTILELDDRHGIFDPRILVGERQVRSVWTTTPAPPTDSTIVEGVYLVQAWTGPLAAALFGTRKGYGTFEAHSVHVIGPARDPLGPLEPEEIGSQT